MNKVLRVADYLGHILEAIEKIDRYTDDLDEVGFLNSGLVQDAVIRNIEVIGEAANNIMREAPAFAAAHGEIPWELMYAMRNRVAHGYHKVDMELVWLTVNRDLFGLYPQIRALRSDFTG